MSAKLSVDFTGFEALKRQLDQIGGEATKRAVEGALKQSQQIAAQRAEAAMAQHTHYSGGDTKASIIKGGSVQWTQDTASIDVGFDIEGGGLPSIFLMYGTTVHGQPHIAPDKELYNAIYGAKTVKQCREAQEEAFRKVIERTMKS